MTNRRHVQGHVVIHGGAAAHIFKKNFPPTVKQLAGVIELGQDFAKGKQPVATFPFRPVCEVCGDPDKIDRTELNKRGSFAGGGSRFVIPACRRLRDFIVQSENANLHPKKIVSEYGDLLSLINEQDNPEALKILPGALPESLLPFPQTTIRHALSIYLLHQDYIEERDIIEDAYIFLDNFIPDEEYNLFRSLQISMYEKERLDCSGWIGDTDLSRTMILLRMRTKRMKKRRKHAAHELRSLRRIMGLPDKTFPNGEEEADEGLELELNL
jgi:hypothetical protein